MIIDLEREQVAEFQLGGYTVKEFIDDASCSKFYDMQADGVTIALNDGGVEIGYRSALNIEHLGRVRQHEWLHAISIIFGIREDVPFTHEVLDLIALGLHQIHSTYKVVEGMEEEEEALTKPKKKKRKKGKK